LLKNHTKGESWRRVIRRGKMLSKVYTKVGEAAERFQDEVRGCLRIMLGGGRVIKKGERMLKDY
jgi:hypothetical protein